MGWKLIQTESTWRGCEQKDFIITTTQPQLLCAAAASANNDDGIAFYCNSALINNRDKKVRLFPFQLPYLFSQKKTFFLSASATALQSPKLTMRVQIDRTMELLLHDFYLNMPLCLLCLSILRCVLLLLLVKIFFDRFFEANCWEPGVEMSSLVQKDRLDVCMPSLFIHSVQTHERAHTYVHKSKKAIYKEHTHNPEKLQKSV